MTDQPRFVPPPPRNLGIPEPRVAGPVATWVRRKIAAARTRRSGR